MSREKVRIAYLVFRILRGGGKVCLRRCRFGSALPIHPFTHLLIYSFTHLLLFPFVLVLFLFGVFMGGDYCLSKMG
jgi:hypothetical protein